jgi:hypothetical protein
VDVGCVVLTLKKELKYVIKKKKKTLQKFILLQMFSPGLHLLGRLQSGSFPLDCINVSQCPPILLSLEVFNFPCA